MIKLETGRRKPYIVRLSNKYEMKLERSLGDGFLKKETEGLILAVQEQALIKNKLDQVQHR